MGKQTTIIVLALLFNAITNNTNAQATIKWKHVFPQSNPQVNHFTIEASTLDTTSSLLVQGGCVLKKVDVDPSTSKLVLNATADKRNGYYDNESQSYINNGTPFFCQLLCR